MRFIILITLLLSFLSILILQVNSQGQPQLEQRPKSNFRFPSRLKIINQYDESTNNNNQYQQEQVHFVQHLPNQNQQPHQQYRPRPEIPVSRECVCPCTKEYLPICGSDFKTYGNNCLFQCQQKCNSALQFRACGTCEEPSEETKLPCL